MSARDYYEAHITMQGDPKTIESFVVAEGWKFSCINGDPSLGSGIKCYATKFFKSSKSRRYILRELDNTAYILSELGCNILRKKVEWVVYDDRSDSVRKVCDGQCIECNS